MFLVQTSTDNGNRFAYRVIRNIIGVIRPKPIDIERVNQKKKHMFRRGVAGGLETSAGSRFAASRYAITFAFVRVRCGRSAPRRVVEERQTLVAVGPGGVVLAPAHASGSAVDGRAVDALAGVTVALAPVCTANTISI